MASDRFINPLDRYVFEALDTIHDELLVRGSDIPIALQVLKASGIVVEYSDGAQRTADPDGPRPSTAYDEVRVYQMSHEEFMKDSPGELVYRRSWSTTPNTMVGIITGQLNAEAKHATATTGTFRPGRWVGPLIDLGCRAMAEGIKREIPKHVQDMKERAVAFAPHE